MKRWEPLARHLAYRFMDAAEREDLEQVARLALLQAARRFDPSRGDQFSTFAVPVIMGHLRHYLRDREPMIGWQSAGCAFVRGTRGQPPNLQL
jgi:RNA polymerase sigma factor (sigma-70 family)